MYVDPETLNRIKPRSGVGGVSCVRPVDRTRPFARLVYSTFALFSLLAFPSVILPQNAVAQTVTVRVSQSSDDAEQFISSGDIFDTSTDL